MMPPEYPEEDIENTTRLGRCVQDGRCRPTDRGPTGNSEFILFWETHALRYACATTRMRYEAHA